MDEETVEELSKIRISIEALKKDMLEHINNLQTAIKDSNYNHYVQQQEIQKIKADIEKLRNEFN